VVISNIDPVNLSSNHIYELLDVIFN